MVSRYSHPTTLCAHLGIVANYGPQHRSKSMGIGVGRMCTDSGQRKDRREPAEGGSAGKWDDEIRGMRDHMGRCGCTSTEVPSDSLTSIPPLYSE